MDKTDPGRDRSCIEGDDCIGQVVSILVEESCDWNLILEVETHGHINDRDLLHSKWSLIDCNEQCEVGKDDGTLRICSNDLELHASVIRILGTIDQAVFRGELDPSRDICTVCKEDVEYETFTIWVHKEGVRNLKCEISVALYRLICHDIAWTD